MLPDKSVRSNSTVQINLGHVEVVKEVDKLFGPMGHGCYEVSSSIYLISHSVFSEPARPISMMGAPC